MGEPDEVASLMRRMAARGHRTFAGRLERGGLALAERAVVALVQAEHGDFRAWADVADWAAQIADELHACGDQAARLRALTGPAERRPAGSAPRLSQARPASSSAAITAGERGLGGGLLDGRGEQRDAGLAGRPRARPSSRFRGRPRGAACR